MPNPLLSACSTVGSMMTNIHVLGVSVAASDVAAAAVGR